MLPLLNFVECCRTTRTKSVYRLSLSLFLECVYNSPFEGKYRTPEYTKKLNNKSIDYLKSDRDHFSDLLQFSSYISRYAPITRVSHMITVVLWLEMNDIIIPRQKLQFIKNRLGKSKVVTKDHDLSHDEIKRWYENTSRLGRVVMLIQLSSGMRIGEVLALSIEDLFLDEQPARVQVVSTLVSEHEVKEPKNGQERYTFISSEAVFAIKEWLKVRDQWIITASKRHYSKNKLGPESPRLISAAHTTIQDAYINGLKKAELYSVDKNTNRATINSHSLRKFFISQMKTAMPAEMVEMLAGHAGYLSGSYRRYPLEQVREEYLKAEFIISLNTPPNIQEMKETKEKLNAVISENIRMESKMEQLVADKFEEYMAAMNSFERNREKIENFQ